MIFLASIVLMQSLPLWGPDTFTGTWVVHNETRDKQCQIILTDKLEGQGTKRGYDVSGDPKCLKRIGLEGVSRWSTIPGGIIVVTDHARPIATYQRADDGTLKGGAPLTDRFTLRRAK